MSASAFSATLSSLLDARQRAVPRTVGAHMAAIAAILRKLAPYAAIELIMPGGSLMAVLLWLYRRQRRGIVSFGHCRSAQRDVALENHSRNIGSSKAWPRVPEGFVSLRRGKIRCDVQQTSSGAPEDSHTAVSG
jgi:hypothetical protein